MKKRNRIDGTAGQQEIVSGAKMQLIEPPSSIKFTEQERAMWDGLIQAKARRAWLTTDLFALSDLCRAHAKLNKLYEAIETLDIIEDLRDYAKLLNLIDMISRRAMGISRFLQIHPAATQGKARNQVAQNQLHHECLEHEEEFEDDGLIARPKKH